MRWNFMSKALHFLQIMAKHQDTVFLTIKTSFQNNLITPLQILLKLHEHQGQLLEEKAPVNDFGTIVPSAEKYCCSKIDNGLISLL